MNNRFQDLASKINSILVTESALRSLEPMAKEQMTLGPGISGHYEVSAKFRPVPMKLHLTISAGVGHGLVFFSQRIPRPNGNNCDKEVPLDRKEVFATFSGSQDNELFFASDSLYFTIYAERELVLTIEYCYGKSKSQRWNPCRRHIPEAYRRPRGEAREGPSSHPLQAQHRAADRSNSPRQEVPGRAAARRGDN